MKKVFILLALTAALVIFPAVISVAAQSTRPTNSISGFVYDAANRQPVGDVYVELLCELETTLRRVKTDGGGRFFFGGMSSGNFKIKVSPYGTNYLEEIQDVSIINYTFGSLVTSDSVYVDIYLKLDKRKINTGDLAAAGAVFIQDVPSEARNFYKKAVSQLGKPKETELGVANLKKAVEIFPDYFDANNRLGIEYVKRQKYSEAVPHLIKAITLNQRSFSSFYALGLAAFNLKQMNEAIEAFRATVIINPQSMQAQLQYGMVLRINRQFKEAEEILLKAKSLDKEMLEADIRWQLALLYDKTERYQQAANELEEFLKIRPESKNAEQIKTLIAQMRAKTQN